MSETVAHMRWVHCRNGKPEPMDRIAPNVSITDGPVAVAYAEVSRDLTERCGHAVIPLSSTRTLDGSIVRREFYVDVKLDDGTDYRWRHVVTRLSDAYRRMPATTAAPSATDAEREERE